MHAMVMTSDALIRDLRDIDWLIGALTAADTVDVDDLDDLCWLLARRRSLSDLLETRRAQKGKKLVSLALWRGCRADLRSWPPPMSPERRRARDARF
jgi:hypothetical protein